MGMEWIIVGLAVALAAGYLARRWWRNLRALKAAGSKSCCSGGEKAKSRDTAVRLTLSGRNIR